MFDLFRSRRKSMQYLLGFLLTMVALSMVVTLIPGFGSAPVDAPDQVIAEVGDDQITLREVQVGLQETIRGKGIPNDLVTIYVPQIVNQIVTDRAVAYYARELGYRISDEDVAKAIQMMVPQLFEGGKFVGKEAYAQFLAANNTTMAEFEKQARMQAALRRLHDMVLGGVVVTPEEIEREYRARNDTVRVDYVKLDPASLRSQIKVTPEEINAHWTVSKASYRIPEKRAFRVLVADEQKIAESVELKDEDLRRQYEKNKEQFRTQERVKVRHILVKTMDKPKDQEESLKKKAEDLLKQIKTGADFAELAKKHSEDTVSAAKGGDLDWIARGQTVKAFEEAAFSLKPKQISELVKTEFGYHIIQTLEREQGRLKPFEEVKEQIARELRREQVYDRMYAAIEQARAACLKNPAQAEQIAQQFHLIFVKVDKAARGDALPQIGSSAEFDEALLALRNKNEVGQIVQVPGNKLAFPILDEIFPPRQAELSEVEHQIRETITNERVQRLLTERSNALLEKVKANKGDLRQAAASLKLEVKTSPFFNREGQVEGIGTASYLEEAFRRDVGAVFGPVTVSGMNFVCKVVEKKPADLSKLAEQRYDIQLRLKQRKAQERKDLFEDGLLQELKRKGVVKIHQDVVNRLVETYKNS